MRKRLERRDPDLVKAVRQEIKDTVRDLSEGGKLALVKCANAFRLGCNWGFVPQSVNYKKELEILVEERPSVKLLKVSNGAIVICDEQFLVYNINRALPGVLSEEGYYEISKTRQHDERQNFERWLSKVVSGKKAKGVKDCGDYYEVTVGLYSINEGNLIRVNEIDYPAFRFRLDAVLDYLHEIAHDRVRVAAMLDGEIKYVTLDECHDKKVLRGVQEALEISSTMTGVFFTFYVNK